MKSYKGHRYSAQNIVVCFGVLMFAFVACAQHDAFHGQSSESDKGLVLVAGATGRTGKATVSELLRNDYRVRAFVRNIDAAREKLGTEIELAEGDVRNRTQINAAVDGVSAVISVVGAGRQDPSNGPEFVDYGGVKNLVDAAADAQVQQFVLVSSMGVTHEDHRLNEMFNNILIWKFKGEEAVRNSGVPYTIVRPGGLTDEPGGEHALIFQQGDVGQGRIPRADVARVVVEALSVPKAIGKTFELIGGEGSAPARLDMKFAALDDD